MLLGSVGTVCYIMGTPSILTARLGDNERALTHPVMVRVPHPRALTPRILLSTLSLF